MLCKISPKKAPIKIAPIKVPRSLLERGWQGIEKIKAGLQQPRKLVISDRTIQTQMRFSVLTGRKAVYAIRKFHTPTIERERDKSGLQMCRGILQIQITVVQPNERKTKSPAMFPKKPKLI